MLIDHASEDAKWTAGCCINILSWKEDRFGEKYLGFIDKYSNWWESWMRSQVESVQIVKRWQGQNPGDTSTLGSQAEDDKLADELETSSQWVRKDISYSR